MASFTGVGDSVTLFQPDKGETVTIAISGTYNMQIDFQKEVGSKNSGVWQTVPGYSYSTANATVAATYETQQFNENLRLVVIVDTSGTAVSTLTSGDKVVKRITDDLGNPKITMYQSGVRFHSPPVTETASFTVAPETHANRPIVLSAAAGLTATLPAATGSGNVYEFYIGVTGTSNAYIIDAFNTGASLMNGVIVGVDDEAEFTWGSEVGADNAVTLGGTSGATGGSAGDYIKVVDIASGLYHTSGFIHHGTGTEANPFSTLS